MKKITQEELKEKIKSHKTWLEDESEGERLVLIGYDLRNSDLSYSDLSDSNLRNSNLRNTNLSNSDLRNSDLRNSDLRDSDLSGSILIDSNLRNSDFRNADFFNSDLSGSDLSYSDLRDADLRNSDLRNSDLRDSNGVKYAQCSFSSHGECGRMLSAVEIDNEIVLFCGCFKGSEYDLRKYIEDGEESYKKSRTLALDFCLSAMSL